MKEMWSTIKLILRSTLTETAVNTWFSDCAVLEISESTAVFTVPDDFRKNVIQSRFTGALKNALKELLCSEYDVKIITDAEAESRHAEVRCSDSEIAACNPEMTFARFVTGESNRLACAAAKSICREDGGSRYNPLFIYGSSGLGKTHLLNAVMNEVRSSGRKVIYCKGDEFTNRLVQALQNKKMPEFREEFRTADLLLLDDIEFLAGKQATQEELFNTFNGVMIRGGRVVLSSDRPPKDLATLEERLRTRFESGILAEIGKPDKAMREEYIRMQAKELGTVISEADTAYLAAKLTSSFRQMKGAMKSISVYGDLLGAVNRPVIDKVLSSVAGIGEPQMTSARIIEETARYFSVDESQLRGSSRARRPSNARHMAMYLCRSMLNFTLDDIGREFGKRDHATVTASIKKVSSSIATDPSCKEALDNIQLNLKMAGCA